MTEFVSTTLDVSDILIDGQPIPGLNCWMVGSWASITSLDEGLHTISILPGSILDCKVRR